MMRKKLRGILAAAMCASLVIQPFVQANQVYAAGIQAGETVNPNSVTDGITEEEIERLQNPEELESTVNNGIIEDDFISMDEEGNVTLIPFEELDTMTEEDMKVIDELEEADYQVLAGDGEKLEVIAEADTLEEASQYFEPAPMMMARTAIERPEVQLLTKTVYSSNSHVVIIPGYLEFTNYETGVLTYTHGSYAKDAAFVGTASNGDVLFKQAGVIGRVSASKVQVLSYDSFMASYGYASRYEVSNGRLYHKITINGKTAASTQLVGYKQPYMTEGATYYSYDGHYFYTDYKTMVSNYKAGHYGNSINPNQPYYNYYQFLSQRAWTAFPQSEVESYVNAKTSSSSKLRGAVDDMYSIGATYGVNPILILGVAINESAWGMSSYAQNRNNLFGHAAYDSSPDSASGYSSVAESIKYHAYDFMSKGYLDPQDWRYLGPHLGDKQSGSNVRYASDPYWGEKAASHGYYIEDHNTSSVKDYDFYNLGIISGKDAIYKDPNKNTVLYTLENGSSPTNQVGVVILGSVQGENINGSTTWYKILSDAPLLDDRSNDNGDGIYKASRDYGYIHSSEVTLVQYGADTTQPPTVTNVAGDANQDGQVKSNDYLMIKDFVMGKYYLSSAQEESADVTGDGKLKSNDYLKIKDYIMGKITSLN